MTGPEKERYLRRLAMLEGYRWRRLNYRLIQGLAKSATSDEQMQEKASALAGHMSNWCPNDRRGLTTTR